MLDVLKIAAAVMLAQAGRAVVLSAVMYVRDYRIHRTQYAIERDRAEKGKAGAIPFHYPKPNFLSFLSAIRGCY